MSETVWNDNLRNDSLQRLFFGYPFSATGGGCSTSIPAPTWQSTLSTWGSTGCGSDRLVSDIAADGNDITGFDIYDTTGWFGWSTIGGTSLSTPMVAALFALAGGAHGVAYPASTLYTHLGNPSDLYDVTEGGNGYCDGAPASVCGDPNSKGLGPLDCDYNPDGTALSPGTLACDAARGYDGPSGVGTPNGLGAFMPTVLGGPPPEGLS